MNKGQSGTARRSNARKVCHLIEVTAMAHVRYSLILGSLQASAEADPNCC